MILWGHAANRSPLVDLLRFRAFGHFWTICLPRSLSIVEPVSMVQKRAKRWRPYWPSSFASRTTQEGKTRNEQKSLEHEGTSFLNMFGFGGPPPGGAMGPFPYERESNPLCRVVLRSAIQMWQNFFARRASWGQCPCRGRGVSWEGGRRVDVHTMRVARL